MNYNINNIRIRGRMNNFLQTKMKNIDIDSNNNNSMNNYNNNNNNNNK
jgi:hypothetical protein